MKLSDCSTKGNQSSMTSFNVSSACFGGKSSSRCPDSFPTSQHCSSVSSSMAIGSFRTSQQKPTIQETVQASTMPKTNTFSFPLQKWHALSPSAWPFSFQGPCHVQTKYGENKSLHNSFWEQKHKKCSHPARCPCHPFRA